MSNKLQGILVQLLKEVDEICKKNDIRYYLWGGTCIGQLRHGGFIPWDDDIDIVMPRADYEKFEAIVDEYMPENRELVSVGRFSTYTNPIPRYMDLNTTALRSGRLGDGTECGECIEIFILDPMPRDPVEQVNWKKLMYVYCEVLCTGWIQAKRKLRKEFVDVDLYNKYRKKMDKIGRDAVLAELESELFSIDEKDSDVYCLRWMPRGLYEIPIRCYGTPKDVIYENMHVLGPERPAEMLQLYIGNSWRNLLPPEERGAHPTLINHSLDCGNCEREYLQIKGTEEMAADMQTAKDMGMEYYRLRNETYVDRATPSMKFALAKTRQEVAKFGLDELKKDSAAAVRVFGDYMRMQRNALYKYNNLFIPLEDELMDVLAWALFEESKMQQLFDILHIKKKFGAAFTETQEQYYRAVKDFIKMEVHMDEKEYELAEEICNRYSEIYPGHRWLCRCRICLDTVAAENADDYKKITAFAEEALAKYPGDDMISKRYADALTELGETEKAREIYVATAKTSINGLLLREMKEQGIEEAALKLDAKVWEFE